MYVTQQLWIYTHTVQLCFAYHVYVHSESFILYYLLGAVILTRDGIGRAPACIMLVQTLKMGELRLLVLVYMVTGCSVHVYILWRCSVYTCKHLY